jgi:hypothetical protein
MMAGIWSYGSLSRERGPKVGIGGFSVPQFYICSVASVQNPSVFSVLYSARGGDKGGEKRCTVDTVGKHL